MNTRKFSYLHCVFFLVFSTVIIFGCNNDLIDPKQPLPPVNVDTSIPAGQPNVILILGDDAGYEIPTYTGGESYSTPNIDKLAAMGVQFSRAYATPLCSPTRYALLTGKYNFRNYGPASWGSMSLTERTIGNMLQDAGYATCAAGKWQFDGGDEAVKTFGFQRYSLTALFKFGSAGEDDESGDYIYKNPSIYQDWATSFTDNLLPTSLTDGLYGEDINRDYMFRFMDSAHSANKPFFCYWAPNLLHKPFSPTPDDPEFATWNPKRKAADADSSYFPSMVKYYDKEIGLMLDKLQNSAYGSNTIVLFLFGDNGTVKDKHSTFKGQVIAGGKKQTYNTGSHEPMIVYWPGHALAGTTNGNLVDLVDFLPTIAQLTNTSKPTSYGPLDGISFAPEIFGITEGSNLRQYSFTWFNPNENGPDESPAKIWAMDTMYKQYDSVKANGFYNYVLDSFEVNPLKKTTDEEKSINARLTSIIEDYKKQAN